MRIKWILCTLAAIALFYVNVQPAQALNEPLGEEVDPKISPITGKEYHDGIKPNGLFFGLKDGEGSLPIKILNDQSIITEIEVRNSLMDYSQDFIDVDLVDFFVNSKAYSDRDKYDFLNKLFSASTNSSLWVINNPAFTDEEKIAYFKEKYIGCCNMDVLQWWYDHVRPTFKTSEISPLDTQNLSEYIRRRNKINKDRYDYEGDLEPVFINKQQYLMSHEDYQKGLADGCIQTWTEHVSYDWGAGPISTTIVHNTASSTGSVPYQMWIARSMFRNVSREYKRQILR